jgi:hypothetical protein
MTMAKKKDRKNRDNRNNNDELVVGNVNTEFASENDAQDLVDNKSNKRKNKK